jgi:hypothetical protein
MEARMVINFKGDIFSRRLQTPQAQGPLSFALKHFSVAAYGSIQTLQGQQTLDNQINLSAKLWSAVDANSEIIICT